jgi:hypothetical protein
VEAGQKTSTYFLTGFDQGSRHYNNETRALTNLTLIREVFGKALDAAPGQREALLAETTAEVRAEVLLLLAAHESRGTSSREG